jgi:hypothetical protein
MKCSCVNRIGEVIDEDVVHSRTPFVACTQQCFAVKAGIDGLLDVARRSFCDTSEGASPAIYIQFLYSQSKHIVLQPYITWQTSTGKTIICQI